MSNTGLADLAEQVFNAIENPPDVRPTWKPPVCKGWVTWERIEKAVLGNLALFIDSLPMYRFGGLQRAQFRKALPTNGELLEWGILEHERKLYLMPETASTSATATGWVPYGGSTSITATSTSVWGGGGSVMHAVDMFRWGSRTFEDVFEIMDAEFRLFGPPEFSEDGRRIKR